VIGIGQQCAAGMQVENKLFDVIQHPSNKCKRNELSYTPPLTLDDLNIVFSPFVSSRGISGVAAFAFHCEEQTVTARCICMLALVSHIYETIRVIRRLEWMMDAR